MSKKNKSQPKMAYAPSNNREVRANYQPQAKEVRTKENPDSTDQLTPAWQFHRCDQDHDLWGWEKLSEKEFIKIIRDHLHSFENMTWNTIKQASGGRASGTNSHPLSIEGFAKNAIKRLQELKLDDISELFSLRLNNTLRLYGIKDGRVLRFIWHDPHHGTKSGAYPTSKK
jgi:hypothetical protein